MNRSEGKGPEGPEHGVPTREGERPEGPESRRSRPPAPGPGPHRYPTAPAPWPPGTPAPSAPTHDPRAVQGPPPGPRPSGTPQGRPAGTHSGPPRSGGRSGPQVPPVPPVSPGGSGPQAPQRAPGPRIPQGAPGPRTPPGAPRVRATDAVAEAFLSGAAFQTPVPPVSQPERNVPAVPPPPPPSRGVTPQGEHGRTPSRPPTPPEGAPYVRQTPPGGSVPPSIGARGSGAPTAPDAHVPHALGAPQAPEPSGEVTPPNSSEQNTETRQAWSTTPPTTPRYEGPPPPAQTWSEALPRPVDSTPKAGTETHTHTPAPTASMAFDSTPSAEESRAWVDAAEEAPPMPGGFEERIVNVRSVPTSWVGRTVFRASLGRIKVG